MATPKPNVAVPMKLDAFILNEKLCDGGEDGQPSARIAPLNQPNYTFLQVNEFLAQNDVTDYVDVHASIPASTNLRMTDLGTGLTRTQRRGVYLHWILPRVYRSGDAATSSAKKDSGMDYTAPVFRAAPNRWLIIRKLDPTATMPPSKIPPIESWVIESDVLRKVDGLDQSIDLQVDVSPFLTAKGAETKKGIQFAEQAEVFIGSTTPSAKWTEQAADRVSLSILNASNPLFPDYQPHNGSVFSFLDRFAYMDTDKTTKYLTSAKATYFVLGWHADISPDPFDKSGIRRSDLLRNYSMTLPQMTELPDDVQQWLDVQDPCSTLCHGAMYDVYYDAANKPPVVLADQCAQDLASAQPVAVGTTALDALAAFLNAHDENVIKQDLLALTQHLRAQGDTVEALWAAADELESSAYARSPGGIRWKAAITADSEAAPPPAGDQIALDALNLSQRWLDALLRLQEQVSWNLFSLWWKYITDVDHSKTESEGSAGPIDYAGESKKLTGTYEALQAIIGTQSNAIHNLLGEEPLLSHPPKSAVLREFQNQLDPTMLVAGVEAGWPYDFMDLLKVRLGMQIPTSAASALDPATGLQCLPKASLQALGGLLFAEFAANDPSVTPPATIDIFSPLYHDQGDPAQQPSPTSPWRDRWNNAQPWFPLFVEWEAEYTHIPWDDWSLEMREAWHSNALYRLGIKDSVILHQDGQKDIDDTRLASGRTIFLPQASSILQSQFEQFIRTSPEATKLNTKNSPEKVKSDILQTPFLSCPLDGLIGHLVTTASGTHVKPNVRIPPADLQPIPQAATVASSVGLSDTQLRYMGKETQVTPYSSLVQFDSDKYPAFKPVTHGQLRFTKINIVDKFGQVVCLIDPTRRSTGPPPLYPCISPYFEPGIIGSGPQKDKPNIVRASEVEGTCEFVQLAPHINQDARLNATFVMLDEDSSGLPMWRPTTDWESPVWGWVIVNYVDSGVQLFLPDGTFYAEARLASPNAPQSAAQPPKWLPFPRPTKVSDAGQLNKLLSQLESQAYLLSFIQMCTTYAGDAASGSSAYAAYINCLIGKPLALVNAGWSLELAAAPLQSQSTFSIGNGPRQDQIPLPTTLLDQPGSERYSFPMKLGDELRAHDGLVGYWFAADELNPGDALALDKLYTYFADPNDSIQPVDPAKTGLSAFWLDPTSYSSAIAYQEAWNHELHAYGTIMDPFQPINVFSAILPTQPLNLAPWTWEVAIKKMTAFFTMGPLLLPQDVDTSGQKLPDDYKLTPPASDDTAKVAPLQLPVLNVAEWSWLQPLKNDSADQPDFTAIGISNIDSKARYQPGPYAATEGFIQMKAPVVATEKSSQSK